MMFKILVLVGCVASALAVPQQEVVEKRQAADVYKVCQPACASLLQKPAEYSKCMYSCFNFNQAFKSIKSTPQKGSVNSSSGPSSASVKNARAEECMVNCNNYMNPHAHMACLGRCAVADWKPSSKSFANPTLPVNVQMLPINPATLTQVTEPITNILTQVIKRQQQIQKMIQSCTCVKPSTPFGQDIGAMGPYF